MSWRVSLCARDPPTASDAASAKRKRGQSYGISISDAIDRMIICTSCRLRLSRNFKVRSDVIHEATHAILVHRCRTLRSFHGYRPGYVHAAACREAARRHRGGDLARWDAGGVCAGGTARSFEGKGWDELDGAARR